MSKETEQELRDKIAKKQGEIKELQKALELIKKPEVRHLDYGVDGGGSFCAAIRKEDGPELYCCADDRFWGMEPNVTHFNLKKNDSKIYGNIYDLFKQGPILVGLTEEEAEWLLGWGFLNNVGEITTKVKSQLKKYQEA